MTNPIKFSFKTEIFPLLILAASVVLSVYFYLNFPGQVATHWNYMGQPDNYSGRAFGAFFLPVMLAAMYLLFIFIPYLDPKKERYADFAPAFLKLRTALILCLFLVFLASGFNNMGYNVPIDKTVPLTIGLLMIYIGNLMGKIKNNWFVGIRTPWTLSSENVWNKTHRFGGYAFIVFGLLIIISPYLGKTWGLIAFVGGAVVAVLGTIVYSYLAHKYEQNQQSGMV